MGLRDGAYAKFAALPGMAGSPSTLTTRMSTFTTRTAASRHMVASINTRVDVTEQGAWTGHDTTDHNQRANGKRLPTLT
jgi:hypothetical protein